MQLMAAWILPFPASEAQTASSAPDVTFSAAAVIWFSATHLGARSAPQHRCCSIKKQTATQHIVSRVNFAVQVKPG